MKSGLKIMGIGRALPKKCVTNADMSHLVETSDEWIRTRTGIETRYICENETQATLAVQAGREAVEDAGIDPSDIKLCLVASTTPTYVMPSTACLVAGELGLPEGCAAMDINAACSGFIYGCKTASDWLNAEEEAEFENNEVTQNDQDTKNVCDLNEIRDTENGCGKAENIKPQNTQNKERKYALLIGAEQFSRILDFTDRGTCVLFGDGAGAVVLGLDETKKFASSFGVRSDRTALTCPGVGYEHAHVTMDGQAVFRFAVEVIGKTLKDLASKRGIPLEDVDEIVCHQANRRILQSTARHLDLPLEKFFMNLQTYGNTSSASIPMALYDLKKEGRLREGKTIYCVGFGAGLTYGGISLDF